MGLRWHNLTLMFWLGFFSPCPAWPEDIYTYTDNEGRIYLSNVPEGNHYQVLIAAPQEPNSSATLDKTGRTAPYSFDDPAYKQIIKEAARANGLDSALLHAVITVESKYNPKAVSHKGAVGLMQLMPNIALQYGIADLYDPEQNIQGGAKYLHDLLKTFNGDVSLALAAYNAGELAVARYGNRIPPYRETSKYVPRVLNFYRKYQASQLY